MSMSTSNLCISGCRYIDEKSDDEYAVVKALHMSGGDGVNSYSANSLPQVLLYYFPFSLFFFLNNLIW